MLEEHPLQRSSPVLLIFCCLKSFKGSRWRMFLFCYIFKQITNNRWYNLHFGQIINSIFFFFVLLLLHRPFTPLRVDVVPSWWKEIPLFVKFLKEPSPDSQHSTPILRADSNIGSWASGSFSDSPMYFQYYEFCKIETCEFLYFHKMSLCLKINSSHKPTTLCAKQKP
jgi:hypothetical protein